MPIYEPVVMLKPERIQIHESARIDSFVKIEGGQMVAIAENVHISSFAHINIGGGTVRMAAGSVAASGAKIMGGSNKKEGRSMSAVAPIEHQIIERRLTVIGENAFVGTNAVVLPGVVIGENAIVGAGAVVTKDVPRNTIVAGVPAVKIGMRPIQKTTRSQNDC